jgi:Protein of unknown function (DUF3995)
MSSVDLSQKSNEQMFLESENTIGLIATMLSVAILAFAAGFHFYWALGGQTGRNISVPERLDGSPLLVPSAALTSAVGFVLLFVAGLATLPILRFQISSNLVKMAIGLSAIVFLGRAISWHTYFGLFKSVRSTRFGRYDTWLYSPLCFVVGLALITVVAKT